MSNEIGDKVLRAAVRASVELGLVEDNNNNGSMKELSEALAASVLAQLGLKRPRESLKFGGKMSKKDRFKRTFRLTDKRFVVATRKNKERLAIFEIVAEEETRDSTGDKSPAKKIFKLKQIDNQEPSYPFETIVGEESVGHYVIFASLVPDEEVAGDLGDPKERFIVQKEEK